MYETTLVLSVLVFVAMAAIYTRHPSASIFNPATFYLAFHGLVFVVRPIFGWLYGYTNIYRAIGFTPSEWDKTQVLLATSLGFVVFMIVSMSMIKEIKFNQPYEEIENRKRLLKIFIPIAIALSLIALYAASRTWQFYQRGESLTISDPRTGGTGLNGINGYLFSAQLLLASVSAIIAYLGRFRLWSLAPVVAFVLLRFSFGRRGDAVAALVMIALLFLYDRRRKWPALGIVLVALAFLPIFNAIQHDRGARIREAIGLQEARFSSSESERQSAPLETMDLANMEFFEYIVYVVPQRSGTYDYFVNNLQLFTEPIPRTLWAGKPLGPPIIRVELPKWGRTIGATSSLPGVGWYSWGYPGVFIWCALFAFIYSSAYIIFQRSKGSNFAVMAFMIFVSTSTISFRDGGLVTILKQLLFFYVPLLLLMLADRIIGRPSEHFSIVPGGMLNGEEEPICLSNRTPQTRRRRAARLEAKFEISELNPISPKARRLARMQNS